MKHNPVPTYDAKPACYPDGEIRKEHFAVFETRNGKRSYSFTMSNGGDRFQEILKRGIPLDQARGLFYQMDG